MESHLGRIYKNANTTKQDPDASVKDINPRSDKAICRMLLSFEDQESYEMLGKRLIRLLIAN